MILSDPRIRDGEPCIAGTRVPTWIVAERHRAGDSVEFLADDYGVTEGEIREAVEYDTFKHVTE